MFYFILLWVQDELNFDRFHENINKLYRVVDYDQYSNGEEFFFAVNPPALAQALIDKYSEVEEVTRYSSRGDKIIEYGDKRFSEQGLSFADPPFFNLFSFPLIKGNQKKALSDPHSIVITEKMAEKYFGNSDPIGKIMRVDNNVDFQVTGVLKNIPSNSHIKLDFIAPFNTIKEFELPDDGWNSYFCTTYVLLKNSSGYAELNNTITHLVKEYDIDEVRCLDNF